MPPKHQPQNGAKGSELELDPADELEAAVSYIRDDLHVRRLRQIWDVINGGLDERYVRSSSDIGLSRNDPHIAHRDTGGLTPAGVRDLEVAA